MRSVPAFPTRRVVSTSVLGGTAVRRYVSVLPARSLSTPGMLYRRKRDFEAASAFVFKRSVAIWRRCVNSRISSSGLLRIFQKRHCS